MTPKWILEFPRIKVIKDVFTKKRGIDYFNRWQKIDGFGSHWYDGIRGMMMSAKNDKEARELLATLFYLLDNNEQSAVEQMFIKYRDMLE